MRARQFAWMAFLSMLVLFVSCRKSKTFQNVIVPEIPGEDTTGNPGEPPPDTVAYSLTPVHTAVSSNVGGYYESLPPSYDSTQDKFPLLIFCHGGGERGDGSAAQLPLVLIHSLPKRIHEKTVPVTFNVGGQDFSFIILSPQFREWPENNDIDRLISHAIEKYRVDESRIYLAGLSMGGAITWEFAGSVSGNKLAAIVPICGASWADSAVAKKIATNEVPAWAFHNEDDSTVTINSTRRYARLINAQNPPIRVRETYWPIGGHDAWTKASDPEYREDGKNMYEWMLQFVR